MLKTEGTSDQPTAVAPPPARQLGAPGQPPVPASSGRRTPASPRQVRPGLPALRGAADRRGRGAAGEIPHGQRGSAPGLSCPAACSPAAAAASAPLRGARRADRGERPVCLGLCVPWRCGGVSSCRRVWPCMREDSSGSRRGQKFGGSVRRLGRRWRDRGSGTTGRRGPRDARVPTPGRRDGARALRMPGRRELGPGSERLSPGAVRGSDGSAAQQGPLSGCLAAEAVFAVLEAVALPPGPEHGAEPAGTVAGLVGFPRPKAACEACRQNVAGLCQPLP